MMLATPGQSHMLRKHLGRHDSGGNRASRERPGMRSVMRSVLSRAVAALVVLACCLGGARAAYPERPVTFIVPFAAGGPTDIIARILATALSQSLGQNVIIDNRGGAAGNIRSEEHTSELQSL